MRYLLSILMFLFATSAFAAECESFEKRQKRFAAIDEVRETLEYTEDVILDPDTPPLLNKIFIDARQKIAYDLQAKENKLREVLSCTPDKEK